MNTDDPAPAGRQPVVASPAAADPAADTRGLPASGSGETPLATRASQILARLRAVGEALCDTESDSAVLIEKLDRVRHAVTQGRASEAANAPGAAETGGTATG